jgi:hypothetical protein
LLKIEPQKIAESAEARADSEHVSASSVVSAANFCV